MSDLVINSRSAANHGLEFSPEITFLDDFILDLQTGQITVEIPPFTAFEHHDVLGCMHILHSRLEHPAKVQARLVTVALLDEVPCDGPLLDVYAVVVNICMFCGGGFLVRNLTN